MKKLVIGILAHVDAGKTTLSEALLYTGGAIRKLGRVDHQNAFLDTFKQERERGITIFSKQAELKYKETDIMLLDTPGHVDFSAEMERTLQVLDYAILVISGKEGVQGHTGTLWRLLEKYRIPTFLFINKMDLEGADKFLLMEELKRLLDDGCVDFSPEHVDEFAEQVAMCDEALLNEYIEDSKVKQQTVVQSIAARKIFPCYFGAALKMEGIESFLNGIEEYTLQLEYPKQFSARVYKIARDSQGSRLTYMKITGGKLSVKDLIKNEWEEKIDQIRIYSGAKYRTEEHVPAGTICAVTGLTQTYPGQVLGCDSAEMMPILEPVLIYQVLLPEDCDVHGAYLKLKLLEEEDPQLHIAWNEHLKEMQIQVMGEVQLEILKNEVAERFDLAIEFGAGRIAYKETIAEPVVGAGHFEPLRHYAEVHLLLEPGKRGSGLVFDSVCSEDVLDRNWQRLILTHLQEKPHIGVLTGSPITDLKITLLTGRAHLKHTEGGDFRQATYRALRQGLRKAKSVLLEPWYDFRLEVPCEMLGRAMSDIQKMCGDFDTPETAGDLSILKGKAPVSAMKNYMIDVTSYTKGRGRLFCTVGEYAPCHNQEEIMETVGYDVDGDLENTADSVFCDHGAGFTVKWDQVQDYLHLDSGWSQKQEKKDVIGAPVSGAIGASTDDAELERIFERTYGTAKTKTVIPQKTITAEPVNLQASANKLLQEYLLVDGYNIIFSWEELKGLAKVNLDAARQALLEILSNYQGYKKCKIIAVFDAYKVKGGERRQEKFDHVDVIFTKEAETADMYIEKATYEMGKTYYVRVATSDNLEQMIILGNGAFKVSANEFKAEIEQTNAEISAVLHNYNRKSQVESRTKIKLPKTDI